jgi:hypothetical protein
MELATDAPSLRRSLCIAACGLSVVGAFLLIVKLSWLLPVEVAWLPYVAHVLGASLSGAALVAATPSRSWRDGAAGGALAIVLLAIVSFGVPHAFSWIPARTNTPWLVVLAIFVASSVCSGLATRLASARPFRSMAAIIFLAITITATVTMLGGRVVHALGIPALDGPQVIVAAVAAFVSALLTQSVVPLRRIAACSLGVPFLAAIHLAETLHRGVSVDASMLAFLLPWGAAALGARLAPPWSRDGLRDVGRALDGDSQPSG